MKDSIAFKNLARKPLRTGLLILMTALLAFTVFGGYIITSSMRSGLSSLQERLGADIMVIPEDAAQKADLENIVLQGNTGYFYMDRDKYDTLSQLEGIGQISPQFFLASASSSCCSAKVQIIGFDPETDFVIQPWIQKTYGGQIEENDIVVGNGLNAFVGDTLLFYGTECHVAAKLAPTGTSYDYSVFTNDDTIRTLIRSSLEKKLNNFGDIDPNDVVSCVLINTAEGALTEEVVNEINTKMEGVRAVQTGAMVSGLGQSLSGFTDLFRLLTMFIWILALVILFVIFRISVSERKREFAVLRVIGASGSRLAGIVLAEALMTGVVGGIIGVAAGLICALPFGGVIEDMMGLPYLRPGIGLIAATAVFSVVISAAAGAAASAITAKRISSIDTGLILRDN